MSVAGANMTPTKTTLLILLFLAGLTVPFFISCTKHEKTLTVYAGKGLKAAMEDIVHTFEARHDVRVNVIYGGSQTILTVLQKTHKGDIFIPGGLQYIEQAGDLISSYQVVAEHKPLIVVRKDNTQEILSFQDLARPGIRLAIGNKKIAAIGRSTEHMFERTGNKDDYLKKIIILGSTANELLDLVIQGEVDAAITHAHLLHLPKSKELRGIDIPDSLMESLKIPLAVLRVSENQKTATLFSKFVATEGRQFFQEHGFGE